MRSVLVAFAAAALVLGMPLVGCSGSPSASAGTVSANSFAGRVEKPSEVHSLDTECSANGVVWRVNSSWRLWEPDDKTYDWDIAACYHIDEDLELWTWPMWYELTDMEDPAEEWEQDGRLWQYGVEYSDGCKSWILNVMPKDQAETGVSLEVRMENAEESSAMPSTAWAIFNSVAVQ